MDVPSGEGHLMERLVAATPLAQAFWMIQTADTQGEYRGDQAHIIEELEKWRVFGDEPENGAGVR